MAMRIAKPAAGPSLPAPKLGAPSVSPRSKTAPRLQGPLSPRGPKPVALKVEMEETLVLSTPAKPAPVTAAPEAQAPPVPAKTPVSSDTPPPPVPRPLPQPQPASDAPPPPVPRPSVLPPKYQAASTPEPAPPAPSGSQLAVPSHFPVSSRASITADFRVKELEETIKGLVQNQTELERSQNETAARQSDYSKPIPPTPVESAYSRPIPPTPSPLLSSNNDQLNALQNLVKQTAETNDKRSLALEQSLNQITQLLREKTTLEEQARVRADKLEDDIRSLKEAHERSLMEEKRKSTALFSEQAAVSEAKLRRDFEAKLKAAEDRAVASEARVVLEEKRAQELQKQLDAGISKNAANGSQVEELLGQLRQAEEQARRADEQARSEETKARTLGARVAELEGKAQRDESALNAALSSADEKIRLLEIRVKQEEERAQKADERASKAEHAKKEADFAAAKQSEEYARRLKDLEKSLPMPGASPAGASDATIADITAKWRAAEEKANVFQQKIEAAMKGLKQYKADKEKFLKTEEDLRKTQEKLKFLEELVGGGPSSVSVSAPVSTPPPAEQPVLRAVMPPPAAVVNANARSQSPAPRIRQDTLDTKLDELFAPGPARDMRIQPIPNTKKTGSDIMRDAVASPARKRNDQDMMLKGNLDTLEAGLAELSTASKPASAPNSKKGLSARDQSSAMSALDAQLDALAVPSSSKSTRIPAPAVPVQLNKEAMNPAYANMAERTMSPLRKQPTSALVKSGDDDEFNPRAGGGGAPVTVPKSKSRRDVQIAEATAQPFDYTNSSEDDKIQKLLAVRGIAQAGGKEAAAPDVSTPMRAAANLEPMPDYEKVINILKDGKERPDPAWTNRLRQTLLHMCCIRNQPKLAKWLVDMHAQVDAKDIDGNTPLHICSILGYLECAEVLLRANASVDMANMNGDTPVHTAAKSGHDALISAMLPYRPQLDNMDHTGQHVLHKAVYSGSKAVINILVSNGAHLDPEDENFYTPLLLAELAGKHDLADMLMMLGADTRCCSKSGDSLLWASIEVGNLARAERLVKEHRLDVNLLCGKFRWSALHRAIMQLSDINVAERTVNFLLQLGAKPDVKNVEEKTPLFFAAYRGSAGIVRALLSAGANPNALDIALNAPLHFAKNTEVASLLLDRGAKINHKNRHVHSALHVVAAFYPTNGDLINLLKNRGADLKGKNKWGHAPLDVLQIANLEKKIVIPFALNEEALPNEMGGIYIGPPRR